MLDRPTSDSTPIGTAQFTNGYEFSQGSGYALPEYPFVPPPELGAGELVRHPIVIVGGGLAGLTLACSLAGLGQKAVLLDEDNTVGVKGASSRGICYTQKSLEIFHKLGIYEAIVKRGIQWSVGRTFAGEAEVYSFDLRAQAGFDLSTQPPFINIQQFYVEGFLVERIYALGHIDLRWKSRVTAFEQNDDFATLTVQTPAGSYQIEAEHVIDATGSHSPFHAWAGASMTSHKGDDRWCIADVRFSTRPPVERHTWIEAPFNENRAVWQHLMADDVWRLDYQMAPNADPAEVSREDVVRERLQRQFGPNVQVDIVWVGPYAYRSQCLHALRMKRVFFMGDTAKIVSPFGARGGNSGIADADNLAWKLAAVLRRQAPPALLASYNDERLQAAQQNVQVTHRTARYLRPADGMERLFRTATIGLARQYPFARSLINTGRMAVANRYTASTACDASGGFSAQNVEFWFDEQGTQPGTLNDLLLWCEGRLLLLVLGRIPAMDVARLRAVAQQWPVRIVQVLGPNQGSRPRKAAHVVAREHVHDLSGHLGQAIQAEQGTWVLMRADAYVVGRGASGPKWQTQVKAMLATALGEQP
jgi:3-(3-hydroxy-phenyl)propionate hydroxylase